MGETQKIREAIDAVREEPKSDDRWKRLERMGSEMELPDDVIGAYDEQVATAGDGGLVGWLGKRAWAFHEQWSGTDPAALERILKAVLQADADSSWALERLIQLYTTHQQWEELLDTYDEAIKYAEPDRKLALLDEAAEVARDVATSTDRAISYLSQLHSLNPSDAKTISSLERLYERESRWVDLINLWEGRLASVNTQDKIDLLTRIAETWLNKLERPSKALAPTREILEIDGEHKRALEILRAVLFSEATDNATRRSALEYLRLRFLADQPDTYLQILEQAIEVSDGDFAAELRDELGAHLVDLKNDSAAITHYSMLVKSRPNDDRALDKLRQVSQRADDYSIYAESVRAAGDKANGERRVALRLEAARVYADQLTDETAAVALFEQLLGDEYISPRDERLVAIRLNELYTAADKPAERMKALERLSQLETSDSSRRAIIGELARLASSLGETERAVAFWKERLRLDDNDTWALNSMIDLLASSEQWEDLIEALANRVAKGASDVQRRSDLVRIARINQNKLSDNDGAIAGWFRVQRECGADTETISNLVELLGKQKRWSDLAELLEKHSFKDAKDVTDRLTTLADTQRLHLSNPLKASQAYATSIAIDPSNKQALEGMRALVGNADTVAQAVATLMQAYRRTGDSAAFVELADEATAAARDDLQRVDILLTAARMCLDDLGQPERALGFLAQAFPLASQDRSLERWLGQLARKTGRFEDLAPALEAAADACGEPRREAEIRFTLATVAANELSNPQLAFRSYARVIEIDPEHVQAVAGAVRAGIMLESWTEIAVLVGTNAQTVGRLPHVVAEEVNITEDKEVLRNMAMALGEVVDDSYPRRAAFELRRAIGRWLARTGNEDLAAQSLEMACDFEPRDIEVRQELVEVLRRLDSARLSQHLLTFAALDGDNLIYLNEAMQVARDHGDNDALRGAGRVLIQQLDRKMRADGELPSRLEILDEALGLLVASYSESGEQREVTNSYVAAARCVISEELTVKYLLQAAKHANEQEQDSARAMDICREILQVNPAHDTALTFLCDLYEAGKRYHELFTIRRDALEREQDAQKRVDLRLELSRLSALLEQNEDRVGLLEDSLQESPGHLPTILALAEALQRRGKQDTLASVLEREAAVLEQSENPTPAAELWSRAAEIAANELDDRLRAINALRRSIDILPTVNALEALSQLHLDAGEPKAAMPWLENLVALSEPEAKEVVALRLATAQVDADQASRAIEFLDGFLLENPACMRARRMLIRLYRERSMYDPLADLLLHSLEVVRDADAGELAREAAALLCDKLGKPSKALPALEKALEHSAGDRVLRSQYARALRAAGKLKEAKAEVDKILEEYGRRRSPERALMQLERSRILQADGKLDEALTDMEQAAAMDPRNVNIQLALARLAAVAEKDALAEKTYRGLLVMLRRAGDEKRTIGASEVLFSLSQLVKKKGEDDQAKDLLASAFDTAVNDGDELGFFTRTLLENDMVDELRQLYDRRIAVLESSQQIATTMAKLARVLSEDVGRHDEAHEVIKSAIEKTPDNYNLHLLARQVANKANKTQEYVDVSLAASERLQRKEDPPVIASLLMLAGEAVEFDLGDFEKAADLYGRAERTGHKTVDALFAIARVSNLCLDKKERARVVDKLLGVVRGDNEEVSEHERIDASYRLAEIMIGGIDAEAGLELLKNAFRTEPRFVQAGNVLAKYLDVTEEDDEALAMYERVARRSGDKKTLLDALQRRMIRHGANPPEVREAVSVAKEIGDFAKAESILESAMTSDAPPTWVKRDLAQCYVERDDYERALGVVSDLAEEELDVELKELCIKAATHAEKDETTYAIAAQFYEVIYSRQLGDRKVWEPLMALYRKLGDRAQLANVVERTIPALEDIGERNALRVLYARAIYEDAKEADAAIVALREAIAEDATCDEAAAALEQLLIAENRKEELSEFAEERYQLVLEAGQQAAVVDATESLMKLVPEADLERRERIYRNALDVAPSELKLLYGLLASIEEPRYADRAEVLELILTEDGERSAEVALQLASIYEQLEAFDDAREALETGWAREDGNPQLRARLEKIYQDTDDFEALCKLRRQLANKADSDEAIELFLSAATIYRDELKDDLAALDCVQEAWKRDPRSETLLLQLVSDLRRADRIDDAIEHLSEALDNYLEGETRVKALLQRGECLLGKKDAQRALSDFEAAWQINPKDSREKLESALAVASTLASESGNEAEERAIVERRISLARADKDTDAAKKLLADWTRRFPEDLPMLSTLRELYMAEQQWPEMIDICENIVKLQEGEDQVQTALQLAMAAEKGQAPDRAIAGLEHVYQMQPGASEIRLRLKQIYEAAEDFEKLAGILCADAKHAAKERDAFLNFKRAAEIYYRELGDSDNAEGAARKALEHVPSDHDVTVLLVDVLIQKAALDQAKTILDEAIAGHKRRSPALGMLQQRMARVAAAEGDADSQLSWLKRAFDVDKRSGEIAAELAQLATEAGDYDLALKPLRAITLMENPEPITRVMALLWEAKIELARGNASKAEMWARKALREDPEYAEAQDFLTQLQG